MRVADAQQNGTHASCTESADSQFKEQASQIEARVTAVLSKVDGEAVALNRRYRLIAFFAAASGTAAVVLAILQLFVAEEHRGVRTALFILEASCAAVALIVVVYGIRSSTHHRWILRRHQAERVRAEQARTLIGLVASPDVRQELDAHLTALEQLEFEGLETWMRTELVEPPSVRGVEGVADNGRLAFFRDSYLMLRLQRQSAYMKEAGERLTRFDRATKHLMPLLFFASVGCVMVHAMFHPLHGELPASVAHVFLLLAACLPVIATGLRTYREAVQVSRNAARFASKASGLEYLRQELLAAPSLERALSVAWRTEQALEGEHREWLRLMLEAEWFA